MYIYYIYIYIYTYVYIYYNVFEVKNTINYI